MKYFIRKCCVFAFIFCFGIQIFAQPNQELKTPEKNGIWLQPSQGENAEPIWGFSDGIQIGLGPLPGPRGLLRVYCPYLGHQKGKMINFIAFEPIPKGTEHRGLSELEISSLDGVRGKRFWSANDSLSDTPLSETRPASGILKKIGGVETLSVYIFSEPFDNGAKVYVRLRFYENMPYEVELTTYSTKESRELDYFIVTATMGNYARLRTLYLKDKSKSSFALWPDYKESNFTPHDITPVSDMIKDKNGGAYFIAAPNEKSPQNVQYASDTNNFWKYYGDVATQYWYCPNPGKNLNGLVNGRYAYWASKSPIPGGIAYENFELKEPFRNGARYIFCVTPVSPKAFTENIDK
ncbi:hypothetical protein ACUNWD_00090 [Sunxiuqinia sp. A32]|uniref:hypothetical protein n=1 Tax=Sunxiuqinia sp. A32 TaxID=3461496 RepID=UPI0040456687